MSKPVVLAVDDDASMLVTLKLVLEKVFTVITANNGEQAIRKLQQCRCDAVLSDVIMPGMDGIQLMKRVRKICPHIPVILFSGFIRESAEQIEAVKHEADAFFKKPFNNRQLINTIIKLVESKSE